VGTKTTAMNITLIISVASLLVNSFIIYLFIQERKSKNRVIEDLKILMDTTDIKRLSEYFKKTDELKSASMIAQTELKIANWFKEQEAVIGTQFDELASFAASIIEVGKNDEERLRIINLNFPNCLTLFQKYLSGSHNKAVDPGNSD
jgi:hypothetical protein